MHLPRISHLQLLILGLVIQGPVKGADVRTRLRAFGAAKSGPAFYQLMARLEDGGLVEGWYEQKIVDSQIIRERHYRVTARGTAAWNEGRDFYSALLASGALAEPANA